MHITQYYYSNCSKLTESKNTDNPCVGSQRKLDGICLCVLIRVRKNATLAIKLNKLRRCQPPLDVSVRPCLRGLGTSSPGNRAIFQSGETTSQVKSALDSSGFRDATLRDRMRACILPGPRKRFFCLAVHAYAAFISTYSRRCRFGNSLYEIGIPCKAPWPLSYLWASCLPRPVFHVFPCSRNLGPHSHVMLSNSQTQDDQGVGPGTRENQNPPLKVPLFLCLVLTSHHISGSLGQSGVKTTKPVPLHGQIGPISPETSSPQTLPPAPLPPSAPRRSR